ncbi:hypothetical protein AAH991_20125 [Microbispora sp. ZYX-F-249]|uniref:ParB/Sulfiredoxin domain-containing protein n=1 Tax=Microbispora maris TaxID=3144104 RepID=A0ABV0AT00_9ACTN
MEYKVLPLKRLLLDTLNPRHDPMTGQQDAMHALLAGKGGAQLLRLAEDIAEYGPSPIELPLVIPEGQFFVVVEGNRRIAAMKLLQDPTLARGSKIEQAILELSSRTDSAIELPCVIAESRDEARRWIELRHNGSQLGVGVVGWSPEMQVRFTGIYSGQRGRALRLTDALEAAFADDEEMKGLLQSVKLTRLTTLGRLASDPDFRAVVGLTFKQDKLTSEYPLRAMRPIWLKVMKDLAGSVTVSSLKNKKQRGDYIEKLSGLAPHPEDEPTQSVPPQEESPPPADRPREPAGEPKKGGQETLWEEPSAEPAPDPEPVPSPRPTQPMGDDRGNVSRVSNQRPRPMRLFYGVRLANVGPKAKDVLREAQRIDLHEYPNAGAALIRILVELVIGEAVERLKWEARTELRDRINVCLAKLDPTNKSDRYLPVRRAMSDRDSPFSMRSMQGYLHNAHLPADPLGLRALSETYATLLRDLDAQLESLPRA